MELKLKKPLEGSNFTIAHGDVQIKTEFLRNKVAFERYVKHDWDGTCVYRYETPERGEEFIKEMYGQVVENGKISFLEDDIQIAAQTIDTENSAIVFKPIPQQEFFLQLRERLKEIVEEVEEVEEPSLEADRIRYAIQEAIGKGYKITIERE